MHRPLLLLLVVAGQAACGSDYGESPPSSGSSSGSSSSSSTSSGSPEGGAPKDAGGPVSAPGKIDCGDKICDVATTICCIENNGRGYSCKQKDEGCNANRAVCDEAADCETGKSCCGTISFGKFETLCQPSCTFQSCRTNAECGTEGCVHQRCTGYDSWLCGKNPFCEAL